MNNKLADALAALLFAGILTCWAEGYWPVALVESGAFLLAGIWVAWITIAGTGALGHHAACAEHDGVPL
jgi:hypothetical protein